MNQSPSRRPIRICAGVAFDLFSLCRRAQRFNSPPGPAEREKERSFQISILSRACWERGNICFSRYSLAAGRQTASLSFPIDMMRAAHTNSSRLSARHRCSFCWCRLSFKLRKGLFAAVLFRFYFSLTSLAETSEAGAVRGP